MADMKLLILLALLCYSHHCHGKPADYNQSEIVGGVITYIYQHPSMAYLVIAGFNMLGNCGGTVLNARFILTGASCLDDAPATIFVIVGVSKIVNTGAHYTSSKFIKHPQHSGSGFDNNIALAKTDTVMKLGGNVRPVQLAYASYKLTKGQKVDVLGWGLVQDKSNNRNPDLRGVILPVIPYGECQESYTSEVAQLTPRTFCAGLPEGGKGVCDNDSGGPAIDSNHVQIGIVSYVFGCGDASLPPVFTYVAPYHEWIKESIKANA